MNAKTTINVNTNTEHYRALHLARGRRIHQRVLHLDGNPVVHAKVRIEYEYECESSCNITTSADASLQYGIASHSIAQSSTVYSNIRSYGIV